MHLVGFIIRIYHDARSSECQIRCSVDCVKRKLFQIIDSGIDGKRKRVCVQYTVNGIDHLTWE